MKEDISLIRVTGVEYIQDYTMCLEFSNGRKKIIDFWPLLEGGLFEALKDHDLFVQFALTYWTLEWVNGADFAPEYLYEVGTDLPDGNQASPDMVAEPPVEYKKKTETD